MYHASLGLKSLKNHNFKPLWHGQYFASTVLENGLSSVPCVYTKIIKPVFSSLLKVQHNNVSYIDESLLKGDTKELCVDSQAG